MGEIEEFDANSVVGVLTQGMGFAIELQKHLNPAATTSKQLPDSLLEGVLSCYDNALKLLGCAAFLGNGDPVSEERGDRNSTDHTDGACSKKRKTLPKWSEQIKVDSGGGFEGQLDDGYNWRKYGQKNILGSSYPRAYYRCTHRNTQGCLATKQVQRSDDDPLIIEVSYRGSHSCMQERIKQDKENAKKGAIQRQNTMIAKEPCLKPEPDQEPNTSQDHTVPFSFPSTPIEHNNIETTIFRQPGNFTGTSYSPAFLSPATSESYFSLSQCNVHDFGIGQSLQSSESDFGEIISNLNSAAHIPFGELDFSLDDLTDCHFFDALDHI